MAGDPAPNTDTEPAQDASALPLARRLAPGSDALADSLRRFRRLWSSAPQLRMPMVAWFDPLQLARTGLATLVSQLVGRRSDARVTLALAAREREYYDYTRRATPDAVSPAGDALRDELWLDYLCDTGDGWNSTYAIAYAAAQPTLEAAAPDGTRHTTRRADVLVFGGDQVYPAPSREEYERRLVVPYGCASGTAGPPAASAPDVYAIPGNHDWYDGLSAFTRLFCTDVGGRWLGGWRTRQARSYFALRLPGRWWLLACDSQLQSDLDTPQIEYFREIADRHMQRGDRAVLCLSEPTWIYAHKYRRLGGRYDETDLLYLREEIFAPRGIDVTVFLAGDLHHYRRHEEIGARAGAPPIQKITAGGGGAFLHPTHDEDVSRISEAAPVAGAAARDFALRRAWPPPRESWRLTFGNLWFALRNPTFGIVTALVYTLTAWLFAAAVQYRDAPDPATALRYTRDAVVASPGLALWLAAVAGAFVLFTDTRSTLYKVLGGLVHAATHGAALFWLAWGVGRALARVLPPDSPFAFAIGGGTIFAGAWLAGSAIVGLYLLVSLNLFGRHSEEAFSALRVQDWKHFLRLQFRADGGLTIHALGIVRVPRRWRARSAADASPSDVQPAEPLVVEMIEPPIVVQASSRAPA